MKIVLIIHYKFHGVLIIRRFRQYVDLFKIRVFFEAHRNELGCLLNRELAFVLFTQPLDQLPTAYSR